MKPTLDRATVEGSTGWFDSPSCGKGRIARANDEGSRGLLRPDGPVSLFEPASLSEPMSLPEIEGPADQPGES